MDQRKMMVKKKKKMKMGRTKLYHPPPLPGKGPPVPWSRSSNSALLMLVYYKSLLEEEQGVVCALQDG